MSTHHRHEDLRNRLGVAIAMVAPAAGHRVSDGNRGALLLRAIHALLQTSEAP